jgi:hypothetical protein
MFLRSVGFVLLIRPMPCPLFRSLPAARLLAQQQHIFRAREGIWELATAPLHTVVLVE